MTSVALLVPALNEADGIVRTAQVMKTARDQGLVSAALVLDSGSTDDTATIARDHGVDVLAVSSVCTEWGEVRGKGDSLCRGVHAVDADWYVFVDADLQNVSIDHVAALVQPAVSAAETSSTTVFVKGGFVRIDEHGQPRSVPGGRVTEQVGRPLLQQVDASLARLTQPLSGQVAIRADVARKMSFVTGYGIEIAMLLDIWNMCGHDGMVEADMGRIHNRWKPDGDLDDVATQVLAGAALRGVTLPQWGHVTHPDVVERKSVS